MGGKGVSSAEELPGLPGGDVAVRYRGCRACETRAGRDTTAGYGSGDGSGDAVVEAVNKARERSSTSRCERTKNGRFIFASLTLLQL